MHYSTYTYVTNTTYILYMGIEIDFKKIEKRGFGALSSRTDGWFSRRNLAVSALFITSEFFASFKPGENVGAHR